jgi:hypothetical protein
MEESFDGVVDKGKDNSDTIEVQEISSSEENQVQGRVGYSGRQFVFLDLLEVQFREGMEPISDLNDIVELEQIGHLGVRVLGP